jgi:hypothetical protein
MSYRGSDVAVARAMVKKYGDGKRWFVARDCAYGGVWIGAEYTPISSDLRGRITFQRKCHKKGGLGEDTLRMTYLGNQLEGWYDAELAIRDNEDQLVQVCEEEIRAERVKDKQCQEEARHRQELILQRQREEKEKRELEKLDQFIEETYGPDAPAPKTGYEGNDAFGSW